MGFVPADLASIPVQQLAPRRLRLGPFGSGRDLVKFLGVATVGAAVAALTTAVAWVPFLAAGVLIAVVRVEGETLDEVALRYCRFRWRASTGPRAGAGGASPAPGRSEHLPGSRFLIRAGGIPIAHLPPADLARLFETWRSTLATFDHPIGCRMRGERFSPLPFLPVAASPSSGERLPLDAYRELVRALLRNRSRRVVDLAIWGDPSDGGASPIARQAQLDELGAALDRMGIPARRIPFPGDRRTAPAGAAE